MLNTLFLSAIVILIIIIVGQLFERQNLENKLADSKKREKPEVIIISNITEQNDIIEFCIYGIQKNMYWSPAGFTLKEKDAQRFPTRGLAATFASNMNCIVVTG